MAASASLQNVHLPARPLQGRGVANLIAQITHGAIQVNPGSRRQALYRMEEAGWLTSARAESGNKRRAKYYS